MSEETSQDTGAVPVEAAQQPSGDQSQGSGAVIEGSSAAVQENIDTLQEQVQDAVDKGASEKEIKSLIKEFELKVNGKPVKAKIDLSDEEAVKRELQKAYAFNDVSQENAQIKKALSAKIATWKSNPAQMFADLGVDATEFSVSHLDKQIEESKKTPEQKAQEEKEFKYSEMEKKIQEYEARDKKLQELLAKQKEDAEQASLRNSVIAEIDNAISKSSILTADDETRSRLADLMHYYSSKYPDKEITAEMVLPQLEKKVLAETKKYAGKFDESKLEELIGSEQLQKLLTKHLQKAAQAQPAPKAAPSIPSQTSGASKTVQKENKPSNKPKSFEDIMRQR